MCTDVQADAIVAQCVDPMITSGRSTWATLQAQAGVAHHTCTEPMTHMLFALQRMCSMCVGVHHVVDINMEWCLGARNYEATCVIVSAVV